MRSLVPANLIDSLFRTPVDIDKVFDNFFNDRFFRGGLWMADYPAVDIEDRNSDYLIKADMPGLTKDDIEIEVRGSILTISGKVDETNETRDDKRGYIRRERRCGQFSRSFELPDGVNPDGVKATFKDGVLEIVVPKDKARSPKRVEIQ